MPEKTEEKTEEKTRKEIIILINNTISFPIFNPIKHAFVGLINIPTTAVLCP